MRLLLRSLSISRLSTCSAAPMWTYPWLMPPKHFVASAWRQLSVRLFKSLIQRQTFQLHHPANLAMAGTLAQVRDHAIGFRAGGVLNARVPNRVGTNAASIGGSHFLASNCLTALLSPTTLMTSYWPCTRQGGSTCIVTMAAWAFLEQVF